ncbi:MAG: alpha/beta fold hydrolase [Proteobacteria bacterium]|nr:alpha/beta fold hydrolase [Pseudomonadota bacterium]
MPVYNDYPFSSKYFTIQGGRLHYIDEGVGPVIVMVHGNPTWSYYYRHLIAHFRLTHRVIAVDHMGCGLSDKPPIYPYCLAQHIENLESLLVHLGVGQFSLIVHDWGGAIGFGFAVQHLDQVDRIALMNTAAFRSTRLPWRIRLCRLPVIGEIIVRQFNGFAGPACFMAVEKKLAAKTARSYLAPYNSWNNRVAIARFVQDIPLHKKHRSYAKLVEIENRLPLLRDRKTPLVILWGGKDFCFNDHFYNEWQRRFPEAESHYFNDGGHYILEDKIAEIIPILNQFFIR